MMDPWGCLSIDNKKIKTSILILIIISSIITFGFDFTRTTYGAGENQSSNTNTTGWNSPSIKSSLSNTTNIQSNTTSNLPTISKVQGNGNSNPLTHSNNGITNSSSSTINGKNNNGKNNANIKGTIIIKTLSASLVAGATYTVSPNPRTGSGSLTVIDGGADDEDGLANGIIKISQVLNGKYAIKQVNIPSGFFSLLRSSGKTINPSHLNKTITFPVVPKNMDLTQLPPKPLPSPSLSDDAFNRWASSVSARIVNNTNSNIVINNADQMPQVILAGSRNASAITTSVTTVSSVLLNASFAPLTNGSTIVNTIGLENYSLPNTANVVTVIPTIVTNVSTTNGYIASTPIVSGVIPGQEMIIPVADPLIPSFGGLKAITVQSSSTSKLGGVNNTNWFVAEVENKIPSTIGSKGIKNTPILFINIQHPFEENKIGFNWSNASNLAVPPTLTIIVHKNSSSVIQQDSAGCPVVNTYTLASGSWTTLGIGELSSKSISRSKCQITITSQHLSKFAFSLMHLDSLVADISSTFGKVTTAAPQGITLTLNPVTSVPWGANIIVSGKLSATSSGVGLGGKTITFTGAGAAGLSSIITKSDGTFFVSGQSPSAIGTGWKINANFAGDSSYVASSATQSYNTLVHSASLILVISPSSVVNSGTYSVTGTLTDTTTGKPLNAMIISSSGTSITVSKTTTTSTGTYLVGGLKAPNSLGTYYIKAQFDGTTLYSPANSLVKTLTVTTAPSTIQVKK